MTAPSPRIRLLPDELIDQIKAGEVIERPANALKELLENALDAHPTRVDVEIRSNGLELIRVSDDGHGINAEDVAYAFVRHATSKISAFTDLYRLDTFGFRGEALPSIASVSRMECASWTAQADAGALIRFEGGHPDGPHSTQKTGLAHGTVMTVKDLFFNTPVRLQFLQAGNSEKNWLKRYFYAATLAWPQITFTLQWDDNEKLLYPSAAGRDARIRQFFGVKAVGQIELKQIKKEWRGMSCEILLVHEASYRSDAPLDMVLINHRLVLDKAFLRAAQNLFDKHFPAGHPRMVVVIDMPGDELDVNVHPNKTVVKFRQHADVLSFFTATLREILPEVTITAATHTHVSDVAAPDHRYRYHREAWLADEMDDGPAPTTVPVSNSISLAAPGPFLFWRIPHSPFPFYVDGKKLLLEFVTRRLHHPSESMPLLVAHPLREIKPDTVQIKDLALAGFELDEIEPNFWVIRSIPSWLYGLPLSLGITMVMRAFGPQDLLIPDFSPEELSPGKWAEVWDSFGVEEITHRKLAIELHPTLFWPD